MGELYGGREAEICGAFQKEQESAGVERSRISRGFRKRHNDRGTSERIGVLNCEGLLEFNLHAAVLSCVAIHSCVAILHWVEISSCVSSSLKSHKMSQDTTRF